jgi:ribosomal protein S25
VNIQLPKRATIISFEPIPIWISFLDDTVSLTMLEGYVEISYVLGVVGTKEHAFALINEAEAIIDEMRADGVNASEAVELLSLANNAYDDGQYMQSEQYAEQAKNQAVITKDLAFEARLAGEAALSSISVAEDVGRTSLLEQAREELLMSQEYYASGNYQESKQLAEQSAATALNSVKPFSDINKYLLGTIGVGIISSLFYLSRKPEKPQNKEIYQMDLEKVFSQHSHLRVDEKEILKFISEAKEGVFVSELRQRFHIPKSTAWRMMRRLEGEGIIQTKSIGRETFVQMNPKYR